MSYISLFFCLSFSVRQLVVSMLVCLYVCPQMQKGLRKAQEDLVSKTR